MFDYIVVGKGLFGAAAARHLGAASARVAIIGPDEPAPGQDATVYASHYDQGRLQRHMSRDLIWARLSHRAFGEYEALEAESGIRFYQPVPSVHLAPHSADSVFIEAAAETARRLAIECTTISHGAQVRARFPMLDFPDASHGYIEHIPAGYINPRDLIRAQLAVAAQRGVTVMADLVIEVRDRGDHVVVRTGAGGVYTARRVLLAVGAYCNGFELLRRKLALRVKCETILLARVAGTELARLADMPSMIYELDAPPIETIYMLPPIRYPDGHYYIKMGSNTAADRYLTGPSDIRAWVRGGASDVCKEAMVAAMRGIIPGLDADWFETRRCFVTYTPEVWPYIDQVDGDRVVVAAGGNGMGAKSSDAIGKIAADLMVHGRWLDELPPEPFRARFEDEVAQAGFEWGACGMAKRKPTPPVAGATGVMLDPARRFEPGPTSPRVRVRRLDLASFRAAAGVLMGEVHHEQDAAKLPVEASWVLVGPGERSQRHRHHEGETWIVMEGHGRVTMDDDGCDISPGDAIYMPPFVAHTIHNPSKTRRLLFLSMWWEDLSEVAAHARTGGDAERVGGAGQAERIMVTSTPPTPNGDLHLGHLAGPYLGADIYARAQRMRGREVYHVTGIDDFQSYVAGKALRTERPPEQVADHYAARIEAALRAAGVGCDHVTRTRDEAYVARIQGMIARLYREGHVVAKVGEYLVSSGDERCLFEFYVSGLCPHCGAPAGGGCCEECGRPNEGVELVEPAATLGTIAVDDDGAPMRRQVRRLVLPLSRYRERLRAFVDRASMPAHLRALVEVMLEAGLPDVPVTHPHHWGLRCTVPGFEDQVISTWVEMGHSLLAGIEQCSGRAPSGGPGPHLRTVQFFGFDNGFYYALLYPLLYELAEPGFEAPSEFMCNEFYLLDGLKFSTSRAHAVWVRDLLAREPADLIRFYLAYTRPESGRTSFTGHAYQTFVADELEGRWREWLSDLGRRVDAHFDGAAPAPGLWTNEHRRFYRELDALGRALGEAYDDGFSPQRATRGLIELVRRGRDFAAAESHWAVVAGRRELHRTAVALELAAARTLAQHAAPIMPDFARRLWRGLGLDGEVSARGFDPHPMWVPAGRGVRLAGPWFERASRPEPDREMPAQGAGLSL
ncbi:FAD-dependent oxidoreductase [Haliangium sp.]|uniref:FAD-dependent oxidoreductase n=1 Tax=Haliangium sp. TaxID=2663208 RepID=UPI003D0A6CF7